MKKRIAVTVAVVFLTEVLMSGCGEGPARTERAAGRSPAEAPVGAQGGGDPVQTLGLSVPVWTPTNCSDYADSVRIQVISVSEAFHALPPLGDPLKPRGDFDPSLLDYMAITVCEKEAGGDCIPVAEFGPGGPAVGQASIVLQDSKYHANWDVSKEQAGRACELRHSVAGLVVGSVTYLPRSARTVPVEFAIENHPRIRGRVLHEQGYGASAIAEALLGEFSCGGQMVAGVLYEEGFSALEVGEALIGVLGADALQAAQWMAAIGVPAAFCGRVLMEAYGLDALQGAGILKGAGYAAAQVYPALKCVFGLDIHEAEQVLLDIGFTDDEVFDAIKGDLIAWYGMLNDAYGPVLYQHPSDPYGPSSVDWFLERAWMFYTQGGQTFQVPGHVTTQTLMQTVFDLGGGEGDTFWFSLDPPARGGDPSTAKAYVNAVRLRDIGVTDLQYWFFYPYNGPGTLYFELWLSLWWIPGFTWENGYGSDEWGNTAPLGEHTGDWESVTLRFDNHTGALIGAFMSQHGNYPLYPASQLEYEGGHVVAYSSLNGHANFPHAGGNGIVEQEGDIANYGVIRLHKKAETMNWTGKGSRFDAWDASGLVAVGKRVLDADWIAFKGIWGPEFPLNLSREQKIDIIRTIFADGITEIREQIPAVAAEFCAVAAAACWIFYWACFAGCMAVTVPAAEIALDPALDALAPGILDDAFPDQSSSGPSSPGDKGAVWSYFRFPDERPRLVSVASPGDGQQVVGSRTVMVSVPSEVCESNRHPGAHLCASIDVGMVEFGIDGVFTDITGNLSGGFYTLDWDTTLLPDGACSLDARLTGPTGTLYDYPWDARTVHVANGSLLLGLALDAATIGEGEAAALAGSFASVDPAAHALAVAWGDGTEESLTIAAGERTFGAVHVYADDPSPAVTSDAYVIHAAVTASGGASERGWLSIRVLNAPPEVTRPARPGLLPMSASGASVSLAASFTDPGLSDTHAAEWSWGDGAVSTQPVATSPLAASHVYGRTGVYGIALAVTDDDGGADEAACDFAVAFEPGTVAGVGAIMADIEEYDEDLGQSVVRTVEASFGFAFDDTAGTPSGGGESALQFAAGGMRFTASEFTLFEIRSHSSLRVEGRGLMNGQPAENGEPYNFRVLAKDASTDTFQVRIWWTDSTGADRVFETAADQAVLDGEVLVGP